MFWKLLATEIAEQIADRITDEVILVIRKRTRISEIGVEADEIKKELSEASSDAERSAILDKIHDLINGFNRV